MAAPLQDSSLRTGRSGQRLAAVTRPGFAGQYEKGNNKIDRNQYSKGSARAGKTVIHRISVRASGSCRGLRPCPYAICVRLQPRLTPSLHPTPNSTGHLMNARFGLSAKFNVITRPKEVAEDI